MPDLNFDQVLLYLTAIITGVQVIAEAYKKLKAIWDGLKK